MLILFIRHGRTDWNAARRIQGRTDIPLSPDGRAEQALRQVPSKFATAHCLSSPLVRARETAELLGWPEPEIVPELIEMDFGDWEGHTHAELTGDDPEAMYAAESMGLDMRPPDGESPREVMERIMGLLSTRNEERIVAVTHKGVIRAGFAAALGWDMTEDLPFRVDWQAGHLFSFRDGKLSLVQANLELS